MSWTRYGKIVNHASDDIEKDHFVFPWKKIQRELRCQKIKSFFYNTLYWVSMEKH